MQRKRPFGAVPWQSTRAAWPSFGLCSTTFSARPNPDITRGGLGARELVLALSLSG